MIIDNKDTSTEKRNPWRLCSSNQVEELKLLLQLIPIWFSCLMFAVVTAQLGTYFTKQGSTMVRTITPTFHIPPASFQVFTGLTILVSVLLYERALVPIARAITGRPTGITILQRIGTGLVLSILAMAVAASVEAKRVNIARDNGLVDEPKSVVPMAIWWLVPQYVICGLADVFTVVGLQELFYDQMPVEMRSVGAAGYISVIGIGSFLSSGLICIVQGVSSRGGREWLGDNINRANLEYFYWVLAALSALNFCGYVCLARRFVYKRAEVGFQGRSGEKELE
ncbi:UNVERIFIED_CONTAM: protein NRT1/ PTR FAMILY 5.4 [Sesamum angustifolium]|uniref:Protein NRT1/ PTR FAMILY 5.4 n=1 Tax=Sesamum angustifolium TaxID=2727405 RepID=A0AAW2P2R9_9LAMI